LSKDNSDKQRADSAKAAQFDGFFKPALDAQSSVSNDKYSVKQSASEIASVMPNRFNAANALNDSKFKSKQTNSPAGFSDDRENSRPDFLGRYFGMNSTSKASNGMDKPLAFNFD